MAADQIDGEALNSAPAHCRNHLVEHAQLQLAGIHFEMTPPRRFIIRPKKMGSAARKICGTPKFVSLLERSEGGSWRRCLPKPVWGGRGRGIPLKLKSIPSEVERMPFNGTSSESYVLPCQATTRRFALSENSNATVDLSLHTTVGSQQDNAISNALCEWPTTHLS